MQISPGEGLKVEDERFGAGCEVLSRPPVGDRGLTLIEIMVAIGLVSVITLLVVGTLARLLNTGGKTAHQIAANMLALEILETAAAAGPPKWGFSSSLIADQEGERNLMLPGENSSTAFKYKLDTLLLRKSPDDLGTLTQITVTVWWWGEQPSHRSELGKTTVQHSRTVYVRGDIS